MNYDDVCCLIIFIVFGVIWIARQISKAKKEKEIEAGGRIQPEYRRKEPTVRPGHMYKPPYQKPQAAYKPAYVQPKPEKTVCKRCSSDDLKYFDSGYVKCNKCGYYYYDGSRRIEHKG
jgi:ribosomal protein L37AE/L43A